MKVKIINTILIFIGCIALVIPFIDVKLTLNIKRLMIKEWLERRQE